MKSRRLSLFLTFLKIGAFTFGGGYAMIALLEHELIEKKGWIGHDEFLDMAAIAESTPGPVAVNAATYVGFHVAGVSGAALATLAVCLPSFLIIFAISQFFDRFLALTTVGYAFRGIQVCVVYLIASAGWKMVRKLPHRPLDNVILAIVLLAMLACSLLAVSFSSIYFILLSGTAGLCVYGVRQLRRGGYGMISLVRETVLSNGWLTESEFLSFIAVSESTPGPLAVNMATFVGSSQGGFWGALVATLGVVLPSFLLLLLIAAVLRNLMKYRGVEAFLSGVRPCVVALILATAVTMGLTRLLGFTHLGDVPVPDIRSLLVLAVLAAVHFLWKKLRGKVPSPIAMIGLSAVLGILLWSI